MTLTTLSLKAGLHRNTLRRLVAEPKVPRFAPDGQDFGPVYPRAVAVAALGRNG